MTGLKKTTSEMTVQMYFENKKYSGGGDITSMTLDPEHGTAEIAYKDSAGGQLLYTATSLSQEISNSVIYTSLSNK